MATRTTMARTRPRSPGSCDLKGNNDLLTLTKPDIIRGVHGLSRFVAGALGPTNRTASISPDVNNPGYRAVTFDDLRATYERADQRPDRRRRRRHHDRDDLRHAERQGRDLRLRGSCSTERGVALPVMISGTITDLLRPHAVGPDARSVLEFGAPRQPLHHRPQLRARRRRICAPIAELGRVADTLVSAYPNAGLPNEFGEYDETPEHMAGADRRIRARAAWSTSSAAAAARRPSISRRSPRRRGARRARRFRDRAARAAVGPGAVHARRPTSLSSMSASAPTSPARRSSAS
jgi:hypothetical protein